MKRVPSLRIWHTALMLLSVMPGSIAALSNFSPVSAQSSSYEGTVANKNGDYQFDIRSGSKTYNVYLRDRAPRNLDNGDRVRVRGTREGDNDIRNASVEILSNNGGGWGSTASFEGTVSAKNGDREFDLRADGRTYNVYLRDRAPWQLSNGDRVRVRGNRTGDNDIRDASVEVLSNSGGGGGWGNTQTFEGTVTKLRDSKSFDISSGGKTYNVYLRDRAPWNLSNGDRVRVRGNRTGDNDISNASVDVLSNNGGGWGNTQSFEGTVSKLVDNSSFDINSDGKTYNVYLRDRLPRQLNKGDRVRVRGNRYGDNDIRNASVEILSNNGGSAVETFEGTVTRVQDYYEFDLWTGNRTYNVYLKFKPATNLRTGMKVRVRGKRFGDNDIREAIAEIR